MNCNERKSVTALDTDESQSNCEESISLFIFHLDVKAQVLYEFLRKGTSNRNIERILDGW